VAWITGGRTSIGIGLIASLAAGLVPMPGTVLGVAGGACVRTADPSHSVARLWDEVMLDCGAPGSATTTRACPQPVPRVGRDVGCVGGL
jgi:hypothetical protein